MPLDPQAKRVLEAINAGPQFDLDGDINEFRTHFAEMEVPSELIAVARTEDVSIPGPNGEIPVRIYTPEGHRPHPLLVYFHGGGWVIGNLETHDGTCRALCRGTAAIVISVDYRLAPEHKFPSAPEDCYTATLWSAEVASSLGGDPNRIAVAGDSAGGNLATVTALMIRERGGPSLCHQLLIYPVTDHNFATRSYQENSEGYYLTRELMEWFWDKYLPNKDAGSNELASPLRAADLSRLPTATIITAELDPLRDEGELYAKRLEEAGVGTRLTRYDGLFHGFFGMGAAIDNAQNAMNEAVSALKIAFSK